MSKNPSVVSDNVAELNWFVMSMLALTNEAGDTQNNYADPVLCLANELREMIVEEINVSEESDIMSVALSFASAVQSLLMNSEKGNMEWLSPVSSLLIGLEEIFTDSLVIPTKASSVS